MFVIEVELGSILFFVVAYVFDGYLCWVSQVGGVDDLCIMVMVVGLEG